MAAHASQVSGSTRSSKYSERFANNSRHSVGRELPLTRTPFDFLRAGLPRAGSSGASLQRSVHLLAHGKARPMEADPDRPRLQAENLRDLFGGQLLHVVQHKNDA